MPSKFASVNSLTRLITKITISSIVIGLKNSIETSVQTPKSGLSSKWRIFPLTDNDYILDDSSDFFYPMAQMFIRTIQTSSFMLTCSDEVQPSTALFYIKRKCTIANYTS